MTDEAYYRELNDLLPKIGAEAAYRVGILSALLQSSAKQWPTRSQMISAAACDELRDVFALAERWGAKP